MHNHLKFTLDRLERVQRERIVPHLHSPLAELAIDAWTVGEDGEPVTAHHAVGLATDPGRAAPDFHPFALGQPWGPAWNTTWFHLRGQVPPTENEIVEVVVDLGWFDHSVGGHCEGFVFAPDGTPLKALHPRNTWIRLRGPGALDGVIDAEGNVDLFIEAAANPLLLGLPPFLVTEHGEKGAPEPFEEFRLRRAEIAVFNAELWEFVRDLEAAGGLAAQLDPQEPRHWHLLRAVEDALDAYDGRDVAGTVGAARLILAEVLGLPAAASAHHITAVGHAHIDSAWLWPVRETVRKLGRTVSNALALLDTDPDVVYTMTSAQHFDWLESRYPALFERVLHYAEKDRFIPVGGMWIEADGVVPTGESLVRQMTYGKRYFAEKFGREPEEIWLPDSFGYSGALPQLARRAGFRWFFTQKISWNDTTTFPHHSFWWEGIDGTRVFTHFPPSDTYAAEVTAKELRHSVANFKDKAIAGQSLLAYGYGDGGGGPTREMAGRAHRFADLDGSPRVTMRPPRAFFIEAEEELAEVTRRSPQIAPVWSGELYLELHRGTLTSQVEMKRCNRRSESLLRVAERLSAQATIRCGAPYPTAELDEIWKLVLLHQFHDILPGTSIAWVHREARDTYVAVSARLTLVIEAAVRALKAVDGARVPAVPAAKARPVAVTKLDDGGVVLDNATLRARWDAAGHIVSMWDVVHEREVVLPGTSLNELQLFRDEPIRWDAWDIDRHTLRHPQVISDVLSLRVVTDGADAGVEVVREFGDSRVQMTAWLRAGARQVDTECEVAWHETEHLLKVSLPVQVRARTAQFETQYGYVERPVHVNTAADEAMFEAAMHRYVHVADDSFGVGILNDGMYGADARSRVDAGRGTVIRLSLLRAPTFPDPHADQGTHTFHWAVVAGVELGETVQAAAEFNEPVVKDMPLIAPLVELDAVRGLAVLDWVKLADDGSGDVIARVYEATGGHAQCVLRPADVLGAQPQVWETDLLERPLAEDNDLPRALTNLDGSGRSKHDEHRMDLGPFQVATIRISAQAARQ